MRLRSSLFPSSIPHPLSKIVAYFSMVHWEVRNSEILMRLKSLGILEWAAWFPDVKPCNYCASLALKNIVLFLARLRCRKQSLALRWKSQSFSLRWQNEVALRWKNRVVVCENSVYDDAV